jgi:hypothetical protein
MKNVRQFKHEIEVRESLDLCGTTWPVVPILDHYNVDRVEASRRKDIDIMSLRDDMAEDAISGAPENRDELYALDIQVGTALQSLHWECKSSRAAIIMFAFLPSLLSSLFSDDSW